MGWPVPVSDSGILDAIIGRAMAKHNILGGTIKEPDAAEKESGRKTDPMNRLRIPAYLPFRGLRTGRRIVRRFL